jgi:cytoskeletal protein CcmA (bactofilin family)
MAEHSGKDILSSDVEIKGSIKFQKELLIDGKVEGEINSDGVLTIGENADIQGEIKTKSITVYGKVRGNITVGERCELKSRCTLQGDLKAARLVIEEGATFIGKSEVTSGGVKPAAAPAKPAPPPDPESEAALVEFIDLQILPYLRARRGERFRLGKARFSDDTFRFVKLRVAENYRSRVEEIQGWCDERRMLDLQTRLHHWLHAWLFIHVPFSFLLLMLTIWHAYVTLFYY